MLTLMKQAGRAILISDKADFRTRRFMRGGEIRSIPGHGRTCQAKRITFIEALRQEGKWNILYDSNFV